MTKDETITEDEAREAMRYAAFKIGSWREYAVKVGVSQSYMSAAANGGPIPLPVLADLGLERITVYRKVQK